MKWQSGDDYSSGGNFLSEPGTYHLCITDIDENPTKRDGSLIDNAAFRVGLSVLDGTTEGQKEKTTDLTFFYPKPTDKDEGKFRRKQIDRFFLAAGLLAESDKGAEKEIDLSDAVGRQIVAKLEPSSNGKYLQLAFADVYHVDDPAVKDIPKSAVALRLVPSSQRKVGSQPSKKAAPPVEKQEAYEYGQRLDVESLDL